MRTSLVSYFHENPPGGLKGDATKEKENVLMDGWMDAGLSSQDGSAAEQKCIESSV